MKVIYVAGAYRGKCENDVFNNIMHARTEALKLWQQGWCVICPHLNSAFMGTRTSDQMFLDGGLELVRRSDAIFMLKGWANSEGSNAELRLACDLGLRIIYEEEDQNPFPV